ncbi:hypothetical protein R1flu_007996 [Riccia fluitans]|uniref:Uncharacterized protein n=1 Tax=Riccia fluitans TaxID=41844 RepID=A0ABD1YAF1_9MARC
MSHLIESSEQTMVETEDANDYDGGQAHKDTATSKYPSNFSLRKDDDGIDKGGRSLSIESFAKIYWATTCIANNGICMIRREEI